MEPDVSMESSSTIRVAVLPIGPTTIPPPLLRSYISMLSSHSTIPLSSISSFYSSHHKSPFTNLPWPTGHVTLRFVLAGGPPSPWEDFQPSRKFHAVVALSHLPSLRPLPLSHLRSLFVSACRPYLSSSLVFRCFGFDPSDEQLEEGRDGDGDGEEEGEGIVMFPPGDKGAQMLHMATMVQDLAARVLMEFEKVVLRTESTGTILKTPLDSQASLGSEEV